MVCEKINSYCPQFPDGRKFCPDTLPQSTDISNMQCYTVMCMCDKNTNGCTKTISVFTDAVEAIRDSFLGTNCQANKISITVTKVGENK